MMKKNSAFSVMELLIAFSLTGIVAGILLHSFHSVLYAKTDTQNLRDTFLFANKIDQYLSNIVKAFDSHPFDTTPRISNALVFLDGSAIPTKATNLKGSEVLFSVTVEQNSLGEVSKISGTNGNYAISFSCLGYCPKESDYLAVTYSGLREVRLICLSVGQDCSVNPLHGALFSGLTQTEAWGMTKVVPVQKRFALFVDISGTFRILGFSGDEVNENQPIGIGHRSVDFSASLNEKGLLYVSAHLGQSNITLSHLSTIGRPPLINFLLNRL